MLTITMLITNNRPYTVCYNIIHNGHVKVIWYSKHNTLIIRGGKIIIVYKNGMLISVISSGFVSTPRERISYGIELPWTNWAICGYWWYAGRGDTELGHGLPYHYDWKLNIVTIYGYRMMQPACIVYNGGILDDQLLQNLNCTM